MTKCVILIDEELPLGLIANTAAVLGSSFGKIFPENIGEDNLDKKENKHRGIVTIPISILRGTREKIHEVKAKLPSEAEGIVSVDFCDVAQTCNNYEEYSKKLAETDPNALNYLGILLYGSKKKINSLTGSLPLLR